MVGQAYNIRIPSGHLRFAVLVVHKHKNHLFSWFVQSKASTPLPQFASNPTIFESIRIVRKIHKSGMLRWPKIGLLLLKDFWLRYTRFVLWVGMCTRFGLYTGRVTGSFHPWSREKIIWWLQPTSMNYHTYTHRSTDRFRRDFFYRVPVLRIQQNRSDGGCLGPPLIIS